MQGWDDRAARNRESCAEVVPERDVELGASFEDGKEGVTTLAPDVRAGAAADFTPGDMAADVVLRSVGVQRDFRTVEYHQQFGLVDLETGKQTVEGDKAGPAGEDAVDPRPECGPALSAGSEPISFEIAIEVPDQVADARLGDTVVIRKVSSL